MSEPTLYEKSVPGRSAIDLPELDVPEASLPEDLLRHELRLPELSQLDVVRHYQRLAERSFGVDSGFYPLGSCTMKYSPRLGEALARLPGFANAHPLQPPESTQGILTIMHRMQAALAEIGGFAAVSLQPAAGAQGELTALLMMRAYQRDRGQGDRRQVLIPDSAHGTNPASTAMAGLSVLQIPTNERGNVHLEALRAACDESVVGLMLTNPNTLGLFEQEIEAIVDLVHGCGGLVYGDGANMNALAGVVRPGDLGIDLMHYNLHKTFSTPHGGGGPGSGPLGASEALRDYLPGPIVEEVHGEGGVESSTRFRLAHPARSIGRMCTYHGNFGMVLRAYAYLALHGGVGLRENSMHAVLNANYLRVRLQDVFPIPYDRGNMHELVCRADVGAEGIGATDVCKRLIDYGIHPPTSHFPLIVAEALMIEPTETQSLETLDTFVEAMHEIARDAREHPERLREAPHEAPTRRLDEVRAARHPILREALGEEGSAG
ncbi:MAG: aminomethyl-transferring glycine dehydrogenase subunit GcvPB [Deltaproteobacteria bacterium]|nr:aminomethyl-transferring glycine dehydrogenase subunit GcvPB [Deltaproteobacteria bacterium]